MKKFLSLMMVDLSALSRWIFLGMILLLALVYFVPIWFIALGGPQFPDPLVVYIWVNKLTGGTDVDIYTINDLNHYIGMKKLYPDAIPEFKIMPYILGFMILGASLTFFFHKMYLVFLGILNLFLVGIAGIIDFWGWLYNYGTDLDTGAALYDQSIDFQPPIFACKDIMNVTACSWPHVGGSILVLAFLTLVFIFIYETKKINNQ